MDLILKLLAAIATLLLASSLADRLCWVGWRPVRAYFVGAAVFLFISGAIWL